MKRRSVEILAQHLSGWLHIFSCIGVTSSYTTQWKCLTVTHNRLVCRSGSLFHLGGDVYSSVSTAMGVLEREWSSSQLLWSLMVRRRESLVPHIRGGLCDDKKGNLSLGSHLAPPAFCSAHWSLYMGTPNTWKKPDRRCRFQWGTPDH